MCHRRSWSCGPGLEALLYGELAAVGAEQHYARVHGQVTAAELIAQLPAAVAATALFALGGQDLVGWASIGCCLAAAALATRLPESPRDRAHRDDTTEPTRYLTTLRSGLAEAAGRSAVRTAILALALLAGLDGIEEYVPLLAQDWGVPPGVVPLVALGVPLAGPSAPPWAAWRSGCAPWWRHSCSRERRWRWPRRACCGPRRG